MTKNIQALEHGKITRLIFDFSWPSMVGMLVMASYNIVDRIFVGRGVGTLALTGIAISFPITLLIIGSGMLIGIGALARVSHKLGEKKKEDAEKILGNAVVLSLIVSILVSGTVYLFMEPLLTMLGGTGLVHKYASDFMHVFLFGIIFQIFSFALNGIIRAEGNPKMALYTLLISGLLNIALNPIFIMVFHWGIKGSAYATLISQFIGAAWVLYYFTKGNSYLKLKYSTLKLDLKIIGSISSIGISPFVMQVAGGILIILFNKTLLEYGGDTAVAAMAIGNSIMMIIMMPIFGLNQGIQPIIGFNYGAKNLQRVKETLSKGIFIATSICIVGFAVVMLFSYNIVSIFSANDQSLVRIGAHGIKIYLLLLPLNGFQIVSWAYFQAVGKPSQAMILTITKQVLLLIPLILILPSFYQLDGVWMAGPIADFFSACIAGGLLLVEAKRLKTIENEYQQLKVSA